MYMRKEMCQSTFNWSHTTLNWLCNSYIWDVHTTQLITVISGMYTPLSWLQLYLGCTHHSADYSYIWDVHTIQLITVISGMYTIQLITVISGMYTPLSWLHSYIWEYMLKGGSDTRKIYFGFPPPHLKMFCIPHPMEVFLWPLPPPPHYPLRRNKHLWRER